MHIVAETFFTIHVRQWEATQICRELDALVDQVGLDVEAFPAFNSLMGAIQGLGLEGGTPVVEEEQIPTEEYAPDFPPTDDGELPA